MSNIQLWQGPDGADIPSEINDTEKIVAYANYLNVKQKTQIVAAFQVKAYDMAAEYAWKKAMVKLRETLATLGMTFIGEMLGRDDMDEYSNIDTSLTDHSTIELAEQLGVISSTAALKLRHSNELITHFFSKNASEEFDIVSAIQVVKSSVQYVLGESDISIALEFSNFRNRLLSESLSLKDVQIEQLIESPLFYIRTVNSLLLASIKNNEGAKLENSLANLNLLIKPFWGKLGENDKWNVGTAYRDVTAAGKTTASVGIKIALLKVGGFDYVPENLRSVTFKKAAIELIEVHFAMNNFYNEPSAIKRLANLGKVIPSPAFIECIQAYIVVYIGNKYGVAIGAVNIAQEKLTEISRERWYYYFEKVLHNDSIILSEFGRGIGISRFRYLLNSIEINDFKDLPKNNQKLYDAILKGKSSRVIEISLGLYKSLKQKN